MTITHADAITCLTAAVCWHEERGYRGPAPRAEGEVLAVLRAALLAAGVRHEDAVRSLAYTVDQAIRAIFGPRSVDLEQHLSEVLDHWIRQFADRLWAEGHEAEAEAAYAALDAWSGLDDQLAAMARRSVM